MALLDIGRVCIKTAGREAGKIAVIVDKVDNKFVLVDGQVKRRKCNIMHLEPTNKFVKIKKAASHEDVVKVLASIGIEVKEQQKPWKAKKSEKKGTKSEEKSKAKEKAEKKKITKKKKNEK